MQDPDDLEGARMMKDVRSCRGKWVLVTGSTRGLGLSICQRLLKDGFRVVGTGRSPSEGVRALAAQYADRFSFCPLDLHDTAQIPDFVRRLTTEHGPVFGLVNNAAICIDSVLAMMHHSQIADMLKVNIEAPILLAKQCTRSMLLTREGRIVNVTSIIAATGFAELSVYAATKAALNGFTRSLARELGKARITVNAVAPGYMETEMTQGVSDDKLESVRRRTAMGVLIEPDDGAAAVAYLLSDDARFITGTTVTVDAGLVA